MATGIRDLKNGLSRYIRRVEAGERIAVSMHGRVVAELGPPGAARRRRSPPSRMQALIEAGAIRLPVESGDPLGDLPKYRLPAGTAARLLEADRDED